MRTRSWKSSGAVHLGDLLDPLLRSSGFDRRSKQAVWSRGEQAGHLLVWVQVDGRADPYAGDTFRIEFERSESRKPATKLGGRVCLDQLLRRDEIDQLIRAENEVIARLPTPPDDHIARLPADLQHRYLSWFEPEQFAPGFDCRFRTEADLTTWVDTLSVLLPPALERASELIEPNRLYSQADNLLREPPQQDL